MALPLLSEFDPVTRSEGSLDPLGLYPIADALAVQLVPGVRERQTHPRFLTAMAVSHSICDAFDEDTVASDGVTEPWLVFEWYLVEGLVRRVKEPGRLRGLPGIEKARAAIKNKVPLSAKRYLKTPSVFGFHGVYRTLARQMEIELFSDYLGEEGYELLFVWCQEQKIPGFLGSTNGNGRGFRDQIYSAVEDGLKTSAVNRRGSWPGWRFFADYLFHLEVGPEEGRMLRQLLTQEIMGFSRMVLEYVTSEEGRDLWSEDRSEQRIHEEMYSHAQGQLKDFLRTILKYEEFSRLLENAFNHCRYEMSQARNRVNASQLAQMKTVQDALSRLPTLYGELSESLDQFEQGQRFRDSFSMLASPSKPVDWIVTLIEHHQRNQRKKPPNGKAPWVETLSDGGFLLRANYRLDQFPDLSTRYVHQYRTNPLWSFAIDLGMVKQ